MIFLPSVTLVMIETREHELAQLAIEDCERHVNFGEVLVFTDRPSMFIRADRRVITVPDWPDKLGWSRCLWNQVPLELTTSHMLSIQWDSWVINPLAWNDEFLDYDYIGAVWHWHKDGKNVGNGGFSMRSTRLMRYVRKHRDRYPCVSSTDDDLLCRKYRADLQQKGFKWAPEGLALAFSFECSDPAPGVIPFGFHAAFNFGKVLRGDDLLKRAQIMSRSPYITKSDYMWGNFCKANPSIISEMNAIEKEPANG